MDLQFVNEEVVADVLQTIRQSPRVLWHTKTRAAPVDPGRAIWCPCSAFKASPSERLLNYLISCVSLNPKNGSVRCAIR